MQRSHVIYNKMSENERFSYLFFNYFICSFIIPTWISYVEISCEKYNCSKNCNRYEGRFTAQHVKGFGFFLFGQIGPPNVPGSDNYSRYFQALIPIYFLVFWSNTCSKNCNRYEGRFTAQHVKGFGFSSTRLYNKTFLFRNLVRKV